MANRIEPFIVEFNPGTGPETFDVTPVVFPDGEVVRLEIVVPPGPSGLMGFKIAHSQQSVIPPVEDVWNIADNQKFDWALDRYPRGGAWEVWGYNQDVFHHSIYLWFHVVDSLELNRPAPASLSIAPGTGAVTRAETIVV